MAQPNGVPSKEEKSSQKIEPASDPEGVVQNGGPRRKAPDMADVVKTAMTVRKWLLSQREESTLDKDDRNGLLSRLGSTADLHNVVQIQQPTTWTDKIKTRLKKIVFFWIEPSKSFYYYETCFITVACLYNLMMIAARAAFDEMQTRFWLMWIGADYFADCVYLLDTLIESRKGYLEDGIMTTEPRKMIKNYSKTSTFWADMVSIFPTDILYIWMPGQPLVRLNRLARCHRINTFSDRTETRTTFPNVFRVLKLIAMIFIIFHWNACCYYTISKTYGIQGHGSGHQDWIFQYDKIRDPEIPHCSVWDKKSNCRFPHHLPFYFEEYEELTPNQTTVIGDNIAFWKNRTSLVEFTDLTKQYMFSFYWSALILTTLGEQKAPIYISQFLFVTIDILIGLLIFATIVGNVGTMVTNMNAAKSEFEERLDGAKQYMEYRKVNQQLQRRVVKWFSYVWEEGQLDEDSVTGELPTKLKAELAIQVHMETLKRVRIFQDCEPGLLVELVLKLKLQVFSPGDYICKKGDVGKEMYIVKRGSLNVVAEDGIKVFVTLKEGSVFGELSVLDIPGSKNGNKRTAGVRSVGYADLFVLSKDDLWDALREYPEAKKLLMAKGREILKKDNLLDETMPYKETGPVKTTEQRIDNLTEQLRVLGDEVDKLYKRFGEETAGHKRRITELERTFRDNRQKIKRDCLMGLL